MNNITDKSQPSESAPLEMSTDEFTGGAIAAIVVEDEPAPQREMSLEAIALQEAEQVLQSLDGQNLDGFNLLGVVANPRAGSYHHATMNTSSSSSPATPNNSSHSNYNGNNSNTFQTPYNSMQMLELTLHQMTEQIDAINYVFDQWSRYYLGSFLEEDDSEYLPPQLESTLEVPPALANLDLTSVQQYMESCGILSHQFSSRQRDTSMTTQHNQQSPQHCQQPHYWGENVSPDTRAYQDNDDDDDDGDEMEDDGGMQELEETIPPIFFQMYFDLTDPQTFCELLVGNDNDPNNPEGQATPLEPAEDLSALPMALQVPTKEILKLPPPDQFTNFLDKVELTLLSQVRSKSVAFFHETNRFGQLKEWISGLVQEVQRVRRLLDHVQDKSVVAWELIPLLDQQRKDLQILRDVLEGANDVLRCKSSIGGLLSANDELHAAEQIQYGRKLLDGTFEDSVLELGRLHALGTVGDQLSQYESLVVANLGDELIEFLLEWNTSTFKTAELHTRVRDTVRALGMCRSLTKIGQLYGNRLNDVIRMTVRTTVGEFAEEADASVKAGVTSMTLERFIDCLDLLFEQLISLLKSAVGVNDFCKEEGIVFCDSDDESQKSATADAVMAAAELSSKSISELLRLRKEAHSLVTLDEMKRLWDACMAFTLQVEKLSDYKATGLRSTLLAQAKAFIERKHESNMSSLVAALDSERWTQCDVSAERQAALTRLCLGRAVWSIPGKRRGADDSLSTEPMHVSKEKLADALVEGVRYKVVWSCLLLVEMVMTNMTCAAHFQTLATNVVGKVAELLRLFNSRTTQLVLGAGAMHSTARLKSINAKHLSLVTQCLGMTIAILPHVRASLMAQLPPKQHTLLTDLDKIKKEYTEHNDKVLNKFVSIIGGIVEQGLALRIATDFDERAKLELGPGNGNVACCVFLDGVSSNARKMHQVLSSLLPPEHLQDAFSRIFAYVDQKIPELYSAAAAGAPNKAVTFHFPSTDDGKRRMLLEVETMTNSLNGLPNVRQWEFTAMNVIARQLDYEMRLDHDEVPLGTSGGSEHEGTEPPELNGTPATSDEKDIPTETYVPGDVTARPIENGSTKPDSIDTSEIPAFKEEVSASNGNGSSPGKVNGYSEAVGTDDDVKEAAEKPNGNHGSSLDQIM